jgi:alanine dehydrogenase
MIIGVPKEIKIGENRVGMTDAGVQQLIAEGHTVYVQRDAGIGSRITNEQFEKVGAKLLDTAEEVWAKSQMIIKVKEPLPEEYDRMRQDQILYTYLHLAAEPKLTKALCDKKVKAIAYETIMDADGSLPLLTPMSEVAGRMATQIGAMYLQKDRGGMGVLLGGVTGVERAKVTVIGGGVVGINSAKMAMGLGADVTILDVNHKRLEYLDDVFQGRLHTLHSNLANIEKSVLQSHLVIGAVLVTGRKAPMLVTRDTVGRMMKGSVIVDVAVDQGGCIETCKPTSHTTPTYEVDGVIHYCVPNMPGAVARTSTYALTNATMKYASMLARMGVEDAMARDKALSYGLNCYNGYVCYEPVAKDLGMEYRPYSPKA